MPDHHLFREVRRPAALFAMGAVLTVAVLSWLGLRLLKQDRDLERQRMERRLEDAAGRVAAEFETRLTRIEAALPGMAASPPAELPAGSVFVALGPSTVDAWPPGRLLYSPVPSPAGSTHDELFWPGEKLEFQDGAYDRAAALFSRLAESGDDGVRAGALIRLARNLRRLSRPDAALSVYERLQGIGDVPVAGVPADLLGRHARCVLLDEVGRLTELKSEAAMLCRGLQSGRWRLDRASYEYYSRDVGRWSAGSCDPDPNRESLAAAVESLWQQWQNLPPLGDGAGGRRTQWLNGTSVLVVWQRSHDRFHSLVAAPCYFESEWRDVWEDQRLRLSLADSDGHLVTGRTTHPAEPRVVLTFAETRLPWTLYVASADPDADAAALAGRRRLLIAGLGVIALSLIGAAYMTGRAISRELAAARLQSDFVSAVSHEFRSPLTAMLHLTELLAESKVTDQARQRLYYGMLSRETKRLHRLVEGLLNFGRMEAGVMQYRPERLGPGELVRNVVAEYREEGGPDGNRVSLQAGRDLPTISADSAALQSAVWNLLDNAVKYSPAESPVEVSVVCEDGQVSIRVSDHGPGIPVAEQARVFERFFRGTSSRDSGVKGTGIGLALVRHIVSSNGGEVRLESTPGSGSVFTIVVPAMEES